MLASVTSLDGGSDSAAVAPEPEGSDALHLSPDIVNRTFLSSGVFVCMSTGVWRKVHAAAHSNLLISKHLVMLDIKSPSLQMLAIEAGWVQVGLQICHRILGFLTRLLSEAG